MMWTGVASARSAVAQAQVRYLRLKHSISKNIQIFKCSKLLGLCLAWPRLSSLIPGLTLASLRVSVSVFV